VAADKAVLNKLPKNPVQKLSVNQNIHRCPIFHWLAWGYERKKNLPIEASLRRLPEYVFRVISDFIE